MKKSMFVVLTIATCLFMAGCANQKYLLADERSTVPTYQGTHHFLIGGIGQSKEINPNDICGEKGISRVETEVSFINGCLSFITMGIYYPVSFSVYCKRQ